jgi:hypothetical protein
MSPPTEDNLGRRRFMLHRDKAVEQSLEKIRRAPDAEWETLTPEERAGLKSVLSEIWEGSERGRWEEYCFSVLTKGAILRLVMLGDDIRAKHHITAETRAAIEAILLCAPGPGPR